MSTTIANSRASSLFWERGALGSVAEDRMLPPKPYERRRITFIMTSIRHGIDRYTMRDVFNGEKKAKAVPFRFW